MVPHFGFRLGNGREVRGGQEWRFGVRSCGSVRHGRVGLPWKIIYWRVLVRHSKDSE